MESQKIAPNRVVSLSYSLALSNGQIADEATSAEPLVFIHGIGQTLPEFDARIEGLSIGEGFSFTLTPEQGYGESDPRWVIEMAKSIFEGPEVPADILQLGAILPMQDQDGNPMDGKLVEIGDEMVKLDFNHPLAGESLHFTGKVESVREATADELDHGHVHGPGGHNH